VSIESVFRRSFPDADPSWSVFGVDVSGWQDPNVLAGMASRVAIAIVKVSEGDNYTSAEAATQCADAAACGIPFGVYHFVKFTGVEGEVMRCLASMAVVQRPTMQDHGYAAGIWLDCEDTADHRHDVPGGYDAYLRVLAARIATATGIPVGIYTAPWWSNGRLSTLGDLPLWVADYADGRVWPSYNGPALPDGWSSAVGWQFDSHTDEYGSLDLNAWVTPTVPPPVPQTALDRWLFLSDPMLTGDDVAQLQQRLWDLGYDPGPVDGIFGPLTEAAVVALQLDRVLVADGIVGPLTAAELWT
jgi:GH25 family lysozyme M1 (1,4-beta-N-acetylmuramidase)